MESQKYNYYMEGGDSSSSYSFKSEEPVDPRVVVYQLPIAE